MGTSCGCHTSVSPPCGNHLPWCPATGAHLHHHKLHSHGTRSAPDESASDASYANCCVHYGAESLTICEHCTCRPDARRSGVAVVCRAPRQGVESRRLCEFCGHAAVWTLRSLHNRPSL